MPFALDSPKTLAQYPLAVSPEPPHRAQALSKALPPPPAPHLVSSPPRVAPPQLSEAATHRSAATTSPRVVACSAGTCSAGASTYPSTWARWHIQVAPTIPPSLPGSEHRWWGRWRRARCRWRPGHASAVRRDKACSNLPAARVLPCSILQGNSSMVAGIMGGRSCCSAWAILKTWWRRQLSM